MSENVKPRLNVLVFNCGYVGTGVGDYGKAMNRALRATGEVELQQVTGQCTCEDRVGRNFHAGESHCAYNLLEQWSRRLDRRRGRLAGRPFDSPERPWSAAVRGARYRRLVSEHAPDVVHYHLDRNYYGLEPLRALMRSPRPPVVVTVHEIEDWGPTARVALRDVDAVLVHSKDLAQRLCDELGLVDNVRVVAHGAPVPESCPSAEGRNGIGCFGHLGAVKGTRYLVGALRRLARRGLRPTVRFFGNYSQEERQAVEASLRRHGLLDQAHFEGFVDGGAFHQAMESVAIVAAPYLASAGSGIVSYALAHGAAVVCTSVGALPETVGDAGRVVPPRRVRALESVLAELLEDSTVTAELGRQGWERARNELAWPVIAERLVSVLREAIGRCDRNRIAGGERGESREALAGHGRQR